MSESAAPVLVTAARDARESGKKTCPRPPRREEAELLGEREHALHCLEDRPRGHVAPNEDLLDDTRRSRTRTSRRPVGDVGGISAGMPSRWALLRVWR